MFESTSHDWTESQTETNFPLKGQEVQEYSSVTQLDRLLSLNFAYANSLTVSVVWLVIKTI